MQVTSSIGIGCPVLAALALLGGTSTLLSRGSGFGLRIRFFIAAIGAHHSLMHFASAAIGLASVASLTKQLDVAGLTIPPTRERGDVIVFQFRRTTAALTFALVSCKHNFLGGLRDISALSKARDTQQKT